MAKDILMPLLSPSMTEGTLVKWLKKEGDPVKSGDIIAEVETDKATMDLEAFDSGIIRKLLIKEGDRVPVQSRIGIIGSKDEKIDESAPAAPAAEKAASPASAPQGGSARRRSQGHRRSAEEGSRSCANSFKRSRESFPTREESRRRQGRRARPR